MDAVEGDLGGVIEAVDDEDAWNNRSVEGGAPDERRPARACRLGGRPEE